MKVNTHIKTVAISEGAHRKLSILSERLNRPKGQLVEECITYAHKLRVDPSNLKEGNPTEAIKTLRNDLVGFIRTQEKTKLQPLLDTLSIASQKITTGMASVPRREDLIKIIEAYDKLSNNYNAQQETLKKYESYLKTIYSTRIDLIKRFELILKNYIEERENINGMLEGKKIKELQSSYLSKVQNMLKS